MRRSRSPSRRVDATVTVPGRGVTFTYDGQRRTRRRWTVTGVGGLELHRRNPVYSCGHAPMDVGGTRGCTASYTFAGLSAHHNGQLGDAKDVHDHEGQRQLWP
jgi:hypothetical protein